MRAAFALFFGTLSANVFAEGLGSSSSGLIQVSADYLYANLVYKEPGVMKESGRFPGVRGEAKLNLFESIGFSAGGSYLDGHLFYEGATFGGTPVTQTTRDYVRDLRYLAHLRYEGSYLKFGYAERLWHNDLIISYVRVTKYNYYPIIIGSQMGPFYTQAEYRIWSKGKNISTMSRVNASAHDVEFTQDKGEGYALEVGATYPFGDFQARVFLAYDHWSVKASDVQNDGTQNLIEPENNTTTCIFGMGLSF